MTLFSSSSITCNSHISTSIVVGGLVVHIGSADAAQSDVFVFKQNLIAFFRHTNRRPLMGQSD